MKTKGRRWISLTTCLCILGVLLLILPPPDLSRTEGVQAASPPYQMDCGDPWIKLSTDSSIVAVDQLFTLHASYYNIGMPWTRIEFEPARLVAFEPPITMPCKYSDNQPTNGCTEFSLRALRPGKVTIRAWVDGEACGYDDDGHPVFYWVIREDTISVILAETVWETFLPAVYH